ncbi:MAG: cytochrome c-type biogenesis protein CcmH [Rhodobacteraceae bacterium]|nr:cytochrome c-type biogenesis protein CcmH [Paracoccaceae bacterium]
MRFLLLILALLAAPVLAVEPSEMLSDPLLEARARSISAGLRCPVCRNESIDESNAVISGELRLLVRERLVAGDDDQAVVDYVVNRFGEFVLLRPDASGTNLILWLAAPLMLIFALWLGFANIARRAKAAEPEALSADEEAKLAALLKADD